MKALTYPAWFTGPKGETAIFESAEDVPNGWTSGAEQQTAKGEPAKAAPAKPAAPAKKVGRPSKKAAKAAPLDL